MLILPCAEKDTAVIADGLEKYNADMLGITPPLPHVDLSRKIEEDGQIVAGIVAGMYWGGALYVDALWVSPMYRGKGYGKALLRDTEDAACLLGVSVAHLDTFDFQAKGFYEKQGYRVYGQIENCPSEGHTRYGLKKTLIGLKRGTVRLLPHDEAWEEEAAKTVSLLRTILGDDAWDVQHVGSTAVRGICAKPIIDIAIAANDLHALEKHHETLAKNGIIFRKEERANEWLYVMGDIEHDLITHHIHAVLFEGEAWRNYIAFRDHLNTHPEDAAAYAALKQRFFHEHANDRAAYTAGKHAFITQILQNCREKGNRPC